MPLRFPAWRRFRASSPPVVAFTTDPVSSSLFQHSQKHAAVTAPRPPQYVLFSPPRPGHVRLTRSERLGGLLPGIEPIRAEVTNGMLEVIGLHAAESLVELQAKADAADRTQAGRLLDQIRIQPAGNRLQLFSPPARRKRSCLAEFTILCPRQRGIVVRGNYSAVRLSDLTAGADVETTHARITLLNVGPEVDARVQEGIIDYSGDKGIVRLFAGWELNLNFAAPSFEGQMEATCEGPVRVLLPQDFSTSFEASLDPDAEFVCRAGVSPRIIRHEEAGRAIYRFGEAPHRIRLTSVKGPVVMDDAAAQPSFLTGT